MSLLPIDQHLEAIRAGLEDHNRLILMAQPGAGKTTRVPLALLKSNWVADQKLLLLEPRRVAARLAASFIAEQLGEPVGHTVGYRMRGDSCTGEHTRLEVVTQGVLLRMLQEDPLLEGVAGIIFDEFHERSLDADVGLAFALDVQTSVRDDLRLVVMSATLDIKALTQVLGSQTPVIISEGRQFPVDTYYRPILPNETDELAALRVIQEALGEETTQDILVILPGVAEIERLIRTLCKALPEVAPRALHGRMTLAEQRAALATDTSQRRIIVSTAITESSVTVDGVNVIIDAGLERVPMFQPRTGLTRLTTRRVNRASADQRRGRAGRQRSGTCFRLWSQEQPLVAHREPEVQQADLSGVVLELARWGVDSPDKLRWITSPPQGAWQSAKALLVQLGILDNQHKLTRLGHQCARWPLEPRLAVMLERARELQAVPLACTVAALLESRDNTERSWLKALSQRLATPGQFPSWLREAKRLARHADVTLNQVDLAFLGKLLALAYPDRIGHQISAGRFQLASGKTAVMSLNDPLAHQPFLVAAGLQSSASNEAKIVAAEPLTLEALTQLYAHQLQWQSRVTWSDELGKLVGEKVQAFGALIIARHPITTLPQEAVTKALLNAIRQRPTLLTSHQLQQLQGRMALLRETLGDQWPDWSTPALLDTLEVWLEPYLADITRLAQIEKLSLHRYLFDTLPWEQQNETERLAPQTQLVPSGKQIALDYIPCLEQRPAVLALKLQEAFGWLDTPAVAEGRAALMVHLLSPARRPLQVTQDLRSFWLNGYPQVRKEMRGRYPKHPWPEDPLTAVATAYTKKR
ncbi:ATP-dependent helicase HrpB [Vreelandella populi]|uniref:ATP-dependent helicase HrpB n=1 Tax=Vreelandella populi TaxID=2498858 RepID=A0A3S0WLZ1_9GAMM|nr:ATP-dependent helicase HrpB [Halomonas populi]RUR37414.1 ATP-dependent helicase HrpB [Halomonas populi]RUR50420.1 ATP-dependent helicase HrpB [Halomonas populi]